MARRNTTFVFNVDDTKIKREFERYAKSVVETVRQEFIQKDVEGQLVKNVTRRLSRRYPHAPHVPVGRVQKLIETIKKSPNRAKARSIVTGKTRGGVITRTVTVQVGHIDTLDKETLISKLDQGSTRMKHFMPKAGDPEKNNTGTAAARKHLWQLLEHPKRSSYIIRPSSRTLMKFTSAYDGGEKWIYSAQVNWRSRTSPTKRAYWFLTAAREVYREDRNIIKRACLSGVNKAIRKSRFQE